MLWCCFLLFVHICFTTYLQNDAVNNPLMKCYSTNFTLSVPKLRDEGRGGPSKHTGLFFLYKKGRMVLALSQVV